jgi:N-acetylglucosamine kinase-like BadF-type ATPase
VTTHPGAGRAADATQVRPLEATLGIDAGQSGARYLLSSSDGGRLTWTGPGVPAGVTSAAAMRGPLLDGVRERTSALGIDRIVSVGAGVTGFHAGARGAAAAALPDWSRRLGTRQLLVADDAVTSYIGALGESDGAVVAAGTGVTVLACREGSPAVRVNGWGPTLGDEGGGYWIGQQGLRSAYRCLDGRTGSRQLARLAREWFGDLETLPARLAQSPHRVAEVAAFARQVALAAEQGDPDSRSIWIDAAHHIAHAVVTAVRVGGLDQGSSPAGAVSVSYTGALFEAGPLLLGPLETALQQAEPRLTLTEPRSDALTGAAELAAVRHPSTFGTLLDVATTR